MDIIEILSGLILIAVIFVIPAALLVLLIWFIVCIVRYLRVPKSDTELRRSRRFPLIISFVISAVLISASAAIFILFSMSLSHM